MSTTYQRRNPEAWQLLVNKYCESGLSGAQFCKQNEISYWLWQSSLQRAGEKRQSTLRVGGIYQPAHLQEVFDNVG